MKSDQWNLAILTPDDDDRDLTEVALLSDRQLSLAALTVLLTHDGRRTVRASARGAIEVRNALAASPAPVLLVESVSSGWREFADVIGDSRTLLLLDPEAEPEALANAVIGGADGFLTRAASPMALEHAIRSVVSHGDYVHPSLDAALLQAAAVSRRSESLAALRALSPRETGILTRVATGRSSKEIAREYGVTSKTVCNHVSNIYAKLHLRHRGQLVLYAASAGLTPSWDLGRQPLAKGA